jgi:hypothetical protein
MQQIQRVLLAEKFYFLFGPTIPKSFISDRQMQKMPSGKQGATPGGEIKIAARNEVSDTSF